MRALPPPGQPRQAVRRPQPVGSMKITQTRLSIHAGIALAILLVSWFLYVSRVGSLKSEIEPLEVAGSGCLTMFFLVLLAMLPRLRLPETIYRFYLLGISVLTVGMVQDLIDEYLVFRGQFEVVVEKVAVVLGVAVCAVGAVTWSRAIEAQKRALHDMAMTDPLTGLINRRGLDTSIKTARKLAESTATSLSILMCDLDHFKSVNDRFGHNVGDRALSEFAEVLKGACRASDIVGRFGGEEFIVVLLGARVDRATRVAAKIRNTLAAHEFLDAGGRPFRITTSIGVAEMRPDESFTGVQERADEALYAAKQNGRDRYVVHESLKAVRADGAPSNVVAMHR
jgi:diguanylate cyclase (GGDEF)-like protein